MRTSEPAPPKRTIQVVPNSQSEISTALIHLYRGELGRMTAYRVRLDTTTNWAVVTTAAIVSYALGAPLAPHFVMVLAVVLNLLFVWIEARRYCSFELIRQRIRLLERGFYTDILGGSPDSNWKQELQDNLAVPELPISLAAAISVRLRRNYLGLITVILIAWILKLLVHGHGPLVQAASVSSIPGIAVLGGAFVFLLGLALLATRHKAPEEG